MINKLNFYSKKIRLQILNTIYKKRKGHIGGSLSCVDIFSALYFSGLFKLNKKNFIKKNNDFVILSKGHAALTLYAVLNKLKISKNFELDNFHKPGSSLLEHPTPSKQLPGIEIETGSLGNGIGVACGIALKSKKKIIVIVGDGELYEGSNWESILMAGSYKMNNLLIIVDRNKFLTLDATEDIMKLESLKKKFEAFKFKTIEVDGHNTKDLVSAYKKFKNNKKKMPTCIIANTLKAKGIYSMQNKVKYHHHVPNHEEYCAALKDLQNA